MKIFLKFYNKHLRQIQNDQLQQQLVELNNQIILASNFL